MKKSMLLQLTTAICIITFIGGIIFFLSNNFVVKKDKDPILLNEKLSIFIDLSENMLYLMSEGNVVKSYPIASGKWGSPSPIGDWQIIGKDTWGEGFGGYWMGLNVPWGIYGIHGTSDPGSIGWRASGGCIRMFSWDAEDLYKYVRIKTHVKIYGGPYGPFGSGFRTLSPGDRGSDVYEVQKRLQNLGFYKVEPDGIYGEYTKKVIFNFQKKSSLPLSNDLNENFYKKLGIYLIE